jgi:hypothetical protein
MHIFRKTRRRARRLWPFGLAAAALVLLWLLSLGLAYRVGVAEQAARLAQLERELEFQGELVRNLGRQAAAAEEALHEARAKLAAKPPAAPPPPRSSGGASVAELQALGSLIDQRLAGKVPIGLIRAAVETIPTSWHCAAPPEIRTFRARTPVTRDPSEARFEAGVTVSGRGEPVRNPMGLPEAWYDPSRPLELTIEVEGRTEHASGMLPITAAVFLEDKEYRIIARAHERKGLVEVAMTVCGGV